MKLKNFNNITKWLLLILFSIILIMMTFFFVLIAIYMFRAQNYNYDSQEYHLGVLLIYVFGMSLCFLAVFFMIDFYCYLFDKNHLK